MIKWKELVFDFIRESPTPYIGERTIAAALETNRRVVRIALAELEQEGRIHRELRTADNGFVMTPKYTIIEEGITHDR